MTPHYCSPANVSIINRQRSYFRSRVENEPWRISGSKRDFKSSNIPAESSGTPGRFVHSRKRLNNPSGLSTLAARLRSLFAPAIDRSNPSKCGACQSSSGQCKAELSVSQVRNPVPSEEPHLIPQGALVLLYLRSRATETMLSTPLPFKRISRIDRML